MTKKNRTYHTILDRNDEISAYILGLWMADGNIFLSWSKGRVRKQKVFCITNTDKQIMDRLGELFGKRPTVRPGKGMDKDCYALRVKSDRLFDVCYAITRSTSKSDKSVNLPDLPTDLIRHFVRGFFDGDGSINFKTYQNRHGKRTSALQTSFTAGLMTGDFLLRLRNLIMSQVSVNSKKVHVGKTNKKLIFNQYDSMLLCQWMYEGASIFMERKHRVWASSDVDRIKKGLLYLSSHQKRERMAGIEPASPAWQAGT